MGGSKVWNTGFRYITFIMKKRLRLLRTNLRKLTAFYASRKVVTPYTGFILSTHFLSEDIEEGNLRYLNVFSKNIKFTNFEDSTPKVIYLQTNQLSEFILNYLDRINSEFTLITGRDHWSKLEYSADMYRILSNPNLRSWFSQNMILKELPIKHFPYGVNLNNAFRILLKKKLIGKYQRSDQICIPFCTVHEKNDEKWQPDILAAMTARKSISMRMNRQKKYSEYLDDLLKHKLIVSPVGDRPDTYRHWEILALGGIPISNLPANFKDLFATHAYIVKDFKQLTSLDHLYYPNPDIASVNYWRRNLKR